MVAEAAGLVSPSGSPLLIGVLNLQGDVREHVAALRDVGARPRLVKSPEDLGALDGLILPGGESTTLSMLLESTGLFDALAEELRADLPVFGTCAGLILLAREVLDGRPDQRTFGLLDVVVQRNGYGRQRQSFEADVVVGPGEVPLLPTVFIRAPRIVSVGEGVEVLAELDGVAGVGAFRSGDGVGLPPRADGRSPGAPVLCADLCDQALAGRRPGRRAANAVVVRAKALRRYILTINCPTGSASWRR